MGGGRIGPRSRHVDCSARRPTRRLTATAALRFSRFVGERFHALAKLLFEVGNVLVFRAVAVGDVKVKLGPGLAVKDDTFAAGVSVADFVEDVGPFPNRRPVIVPESRPPESTAPSAFRGR